MSGYKKGSNTKNSGNRREEDRNLVGMVIADARFIRVEQTPRHQDAVINTKSKHKRGDDNVKDVEFYAEQSHKS